MNRAWITLLLCAPAAAQGGSVPSQAELDAARPGLVPLLVERVQRLSGGSAQRAAGELIGAAFEADDDTTRYLLWREAITLAEGVGDLAFARNLEVSLAMQFQVDPAEATVALLQRAVNSGTPARAASAALFGLALAHEVAAQLDERAMLSYYDASTRAALASNNLAIFTFVRDRLATLRSERELATALRESAAVAADRVPLLLAAWSSGSLPRRADLQLRDLSAVLELPVSLPGERRLDSLTPGDWQLLAQQTRSRELRRALWRNAATAALLRLRQATAEPADDRAKQATLLATLHDLTERLADADGVTRLRFAAAQSGDQLAFANGNWRVEQGELRGASTGSDNYATHRVSFGNLRSVVIRGGIRSNDGLNFRCKVGDVNLLLNWEVADENHLWLNGQRFAVQPRLLERGEEHTIAIFAEGLRCDVCIDGARLWSVDLPSQLAGTITVYPALGSEIFVREILIDGDPDGVVDAPRGQLM